MKIHTVWAVRPYTPDEPELVTAWDEFSVDSNPEGYDEDVKKSLASWGTDLLAHRHIVLEVDYPTILRAFEPPVIPATVDSASD